MEYRIKYEASDQNFMSKPTKNVCEPSLDSDQLEHLPRLILRQHPVKKDQNRWMMSRLIRVFTVATFGFFFIRRLI